MGVVANASVPAIVWAAPFVVLLGCIAVLPLVAVSARWWHSNRNKLIVGLLLGAVTLGYYYTRGFGVAVHSGVLAGAFERLGLRVHADDGRFVTEAGVATGAGALGNALLEYLPFISLLFSLYVISGGIRVSGDIEGRPLTNTLFLAVGGVLASLIGTTGASMLLIRPLLRTNSQRRHVVHTVVFFIFIVSNIGGCLLPIGDPPLFLGYLRGVSFLWTLQLWREWAFCMGVLLIVYFVWDLRAYGAEAEVDLARDAAQIEPIRIHGAINFVYLAGVVAATGLIQEESEFLHTGWRPFPFCRELVQLLFVLLSQISGSRAHRDVNGFSLAAIAEVACLFVGIFITMQVPIEILNARGRELGLQTPGQFFWATGALSGILDNAPTYVVFFQTAVALPAVPGAAMVKLLANQAVRADLLTAISLGAVFMGATTYIGNGPNFMVKSIAEHAGVRMPSFFGYLAYSAGILIPLFAMVHILFLRSG